MHKFKIMTRSVIASCVMSLGVMTATPVNADVIQLGFILDASGSIGASNWSTITTGLSNAINTYIPVSGPDQYEISVVRFDTNATTSVSNFLVTDATSRSNLATQIANISYTGNLTNYTAAFDAMTNVLSNTINSADFTYVNFATDGEHNVGSFTNATTAFSNMLAIGVDNVSVEGIGISSTGKSTLMNNFCAPASCIDITGGANSPNFPNQGFYIGVANAQGYADAIGNKIRIVTNQVPEPASMALIGLGLLGIGVARRQRKAAL